MCLIFLVMKPNCYPSLLIVKYRIYIYYSIISFCSVMVINKEKITFEISYHEEEFIANLSLLLIISLLGCRFINEGFDCNQVRCTLLFHLKDSLNIGFYCISTWPTAIIETDGGKRVKITSSFIIHNITECFINSQPYHSILGMKLRLEMNLRSSWI